MDTPGEGGNSSRETNNAAFETIGARVRQQLLRFEQVQELIERSFDLETHRRAAMQGVSEMLRRLQRVMAEIRRADERIYRESMARGGSGGGESAQRRVIMQRVRRTLRRMQRGIDELIDEKLTSKIILEAWRAADGVVGRVLRVAEVDGLRARAIAT